jgi:hypothetical protein
MVPFWKATGNFERSFLRQAQKICQETAERPLIEDGVVVITSDKSASVRLPVEGRSSVDANRASRKIYQRGCEEASEAMASAHHHFVVS